MASLLKNSLVDQGIAYYIQLNSYFIFLWPVTGDVLNSNLRTIPSTQLYPF